MYLAASNAAEFVLTRNKENNCEVNMKKLTDVKHLFLVAVLIFIGGCKIIVINPEGGQVNVGSTSDFCLLNPGEQCSVDVSNSSFGAQFIATPDIDSQFVRWQEGTNFVCAGQGPTCDIDVSLLAGIPAVEALVASNTTYYAMPVFAPLQETFTVDGKEWLLPGLFTNVTYDQVDAVCGAFSVCPSGSFLNGVNVIGYQLAHPDDVVSLFSALGVPGFEIGANQQYGEIDSTWAPLIQGI